MPTLLLHEVPDDLEVEPDNGGYVCTTPVMECCRRGTLVTLDVRLDHMPDQGEDTYEFSFGFTVSDIEGAGLAFYTQDRDTVRRYLDGLPHALVMPCVAAALAALIDTVQPAYIFRVTKARYLPQKALRKHTLVTDALHDLGYHEVETGTDALGRTFWLMGR